MVCRRARIGVLNLIISLVTIQNMNQINLFRMSSAMEPMTSNQSYEARKQHNVIKYSQQGPPLDDATKPSFPLWLVILILTSVALALAIASFVCSIKFRQKERELQALRENLKRQHAEASRSMCCSTPQKCLCSPPPCRCSTSMNCQAQNRAVTSNV